MKVCGDFGGDAIAQYAQTEALASTRSASVQDIAVFNCFISPFDFANAARLLAQGKHHFDFANAARLLAQCKHPGDGSGRGMLERIEGYRGCEGYEG